MLEVPGVQSVQADAYADTSFARSDKKIERQSGDQVRKQGKISHLSEMARFVKMAKRARLQS
jgi:hypothetical protein